MNPEELIRRFGIPLLYHFTDTRNLESIRRYGLLSLAEMDARGISPAAPGGNEWSHDADRRTGGDEYVHLCFKNQHPMEYVAKRDERIKESVFLEISTNVLYIPGVLMTYDVANKSGVHPMDLATAAETLDWVALYGNLSWSNPDELARVQAARKYEVLVPNSVPVHMIVRGLA